MIDDPVTSTSNRSALAGLRLVDVDTHLTERHDLWTSRAPSGLREKVPQIKEVNGVRGWFINGDIHMGNPSAYSMVRPDRSTALGMSRWGRSISSAQA
jgi:hypothetical protein